jgi:O-acetyl-ADP-ribose deacetylase (regulator of RNase III)
MASLRRWQIATGIHCSSRWKTESRRSFPAISCGAYGYPISEAAQIALQTTREFLASTDQIDKVIFVLWGQEIYDAYRRIL